MPLLSKSVPQQWANGQPSQAGNSSDQHSLNRALSFDTAKTNFSTQRSYLRRVSSILDYVSTQMKREKLGITASSNEVLTAKEHLPAQRNGTDKCESSSSDGSPIRTSSSAKACRHVSFAKCSTVILYTSNPSKEAFYSTNDQELFKAQKVLDALRIRGILASHPMQTTNPLKRLIELDLLSAEELIGLEHKIVDVSGMKKAFETKAHIDSLMKLQETLRKDHDEVDAEQLAHAAAASSSRHVRKARFRAALASKAA